MLLNRDTAEGIANGTITLVLRRWTSLPNFANQLAAAGPNLVLLARSTTGAIPCTAAWRRSGMTRTPAMERVDLTSRCPAFASPSLQM